MTHKKRYEMLPRLTIVLYLCASLGAGCNWVAGVDNPLPSGVAPSSAAGGTTGSGSAGAAGSAGESGSAGAAGSTGDAAVPLSPCSLGNSTTPVDATAAVLDPFSIIQAEQFSDKRGPVRYIVSAGTVLGSIQPGDWIAYRRVNFTQNPRVFRPVVSATVSSRIDVHVGSLTGPILATCDVSPTGDLQTFVKLSCPTQRPITGVCDLFMTFHASSSQSELLYFDLFLFRV